MAGTRTYDRYTYKTTQKQEYEISIAKCQRVIYVVQQDAQYGLNE